MNYRRWIIVGLVAGLAVFSFYHLSTAGSNYQVLTTSDSGFFYGIAREINQQNGMVNNYELSHPPQGKSIGKQNQFQPLMLVTMYRGLNAVNPNISLLNVQKYFSPIIFAIAMIGAFLAARELGGDIAGCASALFFATLVGSIYWTKIGALDREITLILFGTWLFYAIAKVLRSQGREILKNAAFAGLIYGMFLLTWPGAPFLAAIIGATLFLIITEKSVGGLGFSIIGIGLLAAGTAFSNFNIAELIGVFVLLAGFVRIARNWEALEAIENNIISTLKEKASLRIIGGIMSLIGIATILAITMGGYGPDLWTSLATDRIPQFLGMGGGGGVSFGRIATEQASAPSNLSRFFARFSSDLYRNSALTSVTLGLIIIAIGKVFISAKKHHLYALSWLIVVLPMPLAQSRFFRLFWPMWPILAGFGFGVLVKWGKDLAFSPTFAFGDWLERFRNPLVLALVFLALIAPFISNVRSNASDTYPYPHGASLPKQRYHDLYDCFDWIRENTAEDSVLGIEWSYGHFATGAAERASVTDGAQTSGRRGEWQDSPGIKPPDYIKYVEGDKGYRMGRGNAITRENGINGRRIDIRRLQKTTPSKFAEIVKLYENWNVGIDYFVFDHTQLEKDPFYSSFINDKEASALYSNLKNVSEPDNYSMSQQMIQYNFGDEVVYYARNQAFIREDNSFRKIGVLLLLIDRNGNVRGIRDVGGFDPQSTAHKSLILHYRSKGFPSEQQGLVTMGEGGKIPYVRYGDQAIPVVSRVLHDYKIPDYLDLKISENHFSVVKVNRDQLS